ncbi:stage IV sporulation protein FB [Pontibacillus halophilus JSM 076056 = DSM 19796]|uniref:Stage IV sporulation protein FB n=1 Tax=Pontibacillus halophilus JSM 076056 = DSM 19796 TaxID=1385510 RepID=A0A0A5ICE7_9BACI|nr:site-2 protease family protein [Pontibacillus halophilus]KGX93487.1 stage IV sporulation protein FB [Pontibacillus halophilus JSM 076056 = DSM 19796]
MNNLKVFHIHPLMWFIVAVALMTGSFAQLVVIFSIVFIHELGHYGMALFFRWRIQSVMLWPFGGVMKTDEHHSRPFKEELFVVLSGPLQHVWMYGVIALLGVFQVFTDSLIQAMYTYNTVILLFNLLPIWPLDGGKLFFLVLSYLKPFPKAQQDVLVCSLFTLVTALALCTFVFPFTLNLVLLIAFLMWENWIEWKQRHYGFLRYLLRRHEERAERVKGIEPLYVPFDMTLTEIFQKFRRGMRHQIYVTTSDGNRVMLDENECMYAYFTLKRSQAKASDLVQWFGT